MSLIQGRCRRHRTCRALNGHGGPCYGRNGKIVPKASPVTVLKVLSRDSSGKPRAFRDYRT